MRRLESDVKTSSQEKVTSTHQGVWRMNCDKCQSPILENEAHEHCGQTLCDECYMDALSPARSCDPWAIHSAKRLEASGSQGLQQMKFSR